MEGRKRAEHAANREAWDKVRRWEAVVNALGAKLARTPDDEAGELIRVFHDACRHLGQAETAALAVSRIGRRHERYVAG
jgi:hypothetical protein